MSGKRHEAVEDALAAAMLKIDLQLVAFDLRDDAVAELGVEDALSDGHVGAARIAEADRARLDVDHRLRVAVERPAAHRALPAGAASGAAGDVGEWIGALGPVGAPQAFAAAHA